MCQEKHSLSTHRRHKETWRDKQSPTTLDILLARDYTCPKCLLELDDGYICVGCNFDALDVIIYPEMFP
jgi:hypothetical protein